MFLLLANLLMLFVGCFLEPIAAITILVPILMPIAQPSRHRSGPFRPDHGPEPDDRPDDPAGGLVLFIMARITGIEHRTHHHGDPAVVHPRCSSAWRSSPISPACSSGCRRCSTNQLGTEQKLLRNFLICPAKPCMHPFIRLHPRRRRRHRPSPARRRRQRRGHHRARPHPGRPQGRDPRHRRRRAGAPLQPDHRLRHARRSRAGEHVHTHNLDMGRKGDFERDYAFGADVKPRARAAARRRFMGIVRADGRVATRNYIGILTSVNCSATAARAIADHFSRQTNPAALAAYPERRRRGRADARHRLRHGQRGRGMQTAASARSPAMRTHANFAGVLVVGLGCEANQINAWLAHAAACAKARRCSVFNIQDSGGTAQDGGEGHRADRGDAAAGERGQARAVPRRATSRSACSAAAPTATRASAPTRRSARRSTCWCATAAPRSCPRRPRSTAPSTC